MRSFGALWVVYLVVEVVLITLSGARTLPQGLIARASEWLCDLPDRVLGGRAVRGLSGIEVEFAATRCRALGRCRGLATGQQGANLVG